MSQQRINWIVSLRAISAAAIVLLHVVAGWESGGGIPLGIRWYIDDVFIQLLVRWAVPCFIMISGSLLLNPQKELELHKVMRYIGRMFAVLITFGLGFCFIETYMNGTHDIKGLIIVSLKNLAEGKSWSHMWYIYMLIGLYMITPMLRVFVKGTSEKTYRFTLLVLFVFTILIPTIGRITGLEIETFIPIGTSYLFYYLMGYYLSKRDVNRTIMLALGVSGILGLVITCVMQSEDIQIGTEPDNIFVAMYAVTIFAIAGKSVWLAKAADSKIIKSVSKYSFGIYILHPMFLNILNKGLGVFPDILPMLIGETAFFITAFLGAYLCSVLLCLIRPIRKILI